jgi:hypothetical protein
VENESWDMKSEQSLKEWRRKRGPAVKVLTAQSVRMQRRTQRLLLRTDCDALTKLAWRYVPLILSEAAILLPSPLLTDCSTLPWGPNHRPGTVAASAGHDEAVIQCV